MAPPIAPTKSRGSVSKKATMPIATGDCEICQTSQLCATFCMKSPELEINAPCNKRRKLRCLSERRVRSCQSLCMFERNAEFPIFSLRDHAMIEKTGHDS